MNSEITEAWNNCLAAAQRYGDYVTALNSIDADIESASGTSSSSSSKVLGSSVSDSSYTNTDMISAIVDQMQKYSAQWSTYNTKAENEALHNKAAALASRLPAYGVEVEYDPHKGTWTIIADSNKSGNIGKLLYNCYHTGGIVGDDSTLEDNEVLAKLEKGESVLTEKMWDNLTDMVERISKLSSMVDKLSNYTGSDALLKAMTVSTGSTVSNVTNNNRPITITFGDTRIEGQATDKTVQEHVKVTYEMMNEVARMLKVKL